MSKKKKLKKKKEQTFEIKWTGSSQASYSLLVSIDIDGPRYYHTKSDRERQISHDFTYTQNFLNDTNKPIYKTETDSWLPKGKGGGEG